MEKESNAQEEHIAWIHKEKRIVTFRETEGYKKLIFRSQAQKLECIYRLCECGYRIL